MIDMEEGSDYEVISIGDEAKFDAKVCVLADLQKPKMNKKKDSKYINPNTGKEFKKMSKKQQKKNNRYSPVNQLA